jgi:1-aminocyclopropane-1-carboxylate deaminase
MTKAKEHLTSFCEKHTSSDFILHSRSHKMQKEDLYVKRDDELIFGSKLRKYASILPFLQKNKDATIALVGSCYSNHILSFFSLLKQEGIPTYLFLEKPRQRDYYKGNCFFLSLLMTEQEVIWIDKAPNALTPAWKEKQEAIMGKPLLWIPMGGYMEEALPGALSLPLDIIRNEESMQKEFSHIFVDAGTGLSAIALILGYAFLEKKSIIHTVLMAGSKEEFQHNLSKAHKSLEALLQRPIPFPENFTLLYPCVAKSFGSVNRAVLEVICDTAKKEGLLLDPLYSSKLLLTVKQAQLQNELQGNTLWIHSGGVLSLTGFQEMLMSRSKGSLF